MSEQYRLLVFDWDGTLMDSAAQIVAAMNAAIGDLMGDPPSCWVRGSSLPGDRGGR
jgi:phosphoglycolate phosphatase